MPFEHTFCCPLPNGLHARPASHLAEVAGRFTAQITLTNERSGFTADAASVLDLVSAGIMHGDACQLRAAGVDAVAALEACRTFIDEVLPGCDEPLTSPAAVSQVHPPRVIKDPTVGFIAGTPVAPGIGIGQLVSLAGAGLRDYLAGAVPGAPEVERRRLDEALAAVQGGLAAELERALDATAADILRATLALARDRSLAAELTARLEATPVCAAQAVVSAIEALSLRLEATGSAYLRERVVDLEDIGRQLLEQLGDGAPPTAAVTLTAPAIVSADHLSPRQFLALDRRYLQGLLLAEAGMTSHAVILARSLGIPALTGVAAARGLPAGQEIVVDANRGLIVHPVTAEVRRCYERELAVARERNARLALAASAPAQTADGHAVEIAANIASVVEAAVASDRGADGIGLFRTELYFASLDHLPTEQEQYEVYRDTVLALNGRPVILRTLDIGGDKPLPGLDLPPEANPFLGYRGIRIYPDHAAIIDTQLRALLRASAHGPVRVMAPMVTNVAEARWLRERCRELAAELTAAGTACDAALQTGIMLETPAAALLTDQFCPHVDFFSIGTNDLCQYTLAVDRGNPRVAHLFDEHHPALLRLIAQIVDAAHRQGRPVGLCGEMAGRPANLPLLVGLGLDELSLGAAGIPSIKSVLGRLSHTACRELLAQALDSPDAAAVTELLDGFTTAQPAEPLLSPELVRTGVACRTKAEAIAELCGMLHLAGRSDSPQLLEDAVWAREETYSTGLGHGIAIPHCQSSAVSVNTLAVIKTTEPLEWGALDGAPVDCVILLASRADSTDNTHLRVFAKLARKLMDDEFRRVLATATTATAVFEHLQGNLISSPAEEQPT